jgi:membrane fusion protein
MTRLFHQKAIDWQADRLHGEVLLLPRLSHALILAAVILWVAAVILWLYNCNYSRKESVIGWLEPVSGIIRIHTQRSGIIKKILVHEGEWVNENQPLMVVNGDQILEGGEHLDVILLNEYESQKRLLSGQLERNEKIYLQQKKDIEQRIAFSKADLSLLDKQIVAHTRRYELIAEQAERYRKLRKEGYVSSVEQEIFVAQELELVSERQSLERNRVNLRNQIQQLENELLLLPEEYANSADQF